MAISLLLLDRGQIFSAVECGRFAVTCAMGCDRDKSRAPVVKPRPHFQSPGQPSSPQTIPPHCLPDNRDHDLACAAVAGELSDSWLKCSTPVSLVHIYFNHLPKCHESMYLRSSSWPCLTFPCSFALPCANWQHV